MGAAPAPAVTYASPAPAVTYGAPAPPVIYGSLPQAASGPVVTYGSLPQTASGPVVTYGSLPQPSTSYTPVAGYQGSYAAPVATNTAPAPSVFDIIDRNHDGVITRSELAAAF